jgi:hypothetical protein
MFLDAWIGIAMVAGGLVGMVFGVFARIARYSSPPQSGDDPWRPPCKMPGVDLLLHGIRRILDGRPRPD